MNTASLFMPTLQFKAMPASAIRLPTLIDGTQDASNGLKKETFGACVSPAVRFHLALNNVPPLTGVVEQLRASLVAPQVASIHRVHALRISGAASRSATANVENSSELLLSAWQRVLFQLSRCPSCHVPFIWIGTP